jgi:hypothetical protein
MLKYPQKLANLTEKELAELNFTALLYLHLKIDRVEDCLEHLSKQSGYQYQSTDKKPVMHTTNIYKRVDELLQSLETTIAADIAKKMNE